MSAPRCNSRVTILAWPLSARHRYDAPASSSAHRTAAPLLLMRRGRRGPATAHCYALCPLARLRRAGDVRRAVRRQKPPPRASGPASRDRCVCSLFRPFPTRDGRPDWGNRKSIPKLRSYVRLKTTTSGCIPPVARSKSHVTVHVRVRARSAAGGRRAPPRPTTCRACCPVALSRLHAA